MSCEASLTRRILGYINNKCEPGMSCVRFDTATRLGDYDPETVPRHVSRLREDGLLRVIEVKTGAHEQPAEITI